MALLLYREKSKSLVLYRLLQKSFTENFFGRKKEKKGSYLNLKIAASIKQNKPVRTQF